MSTDLHGAPLAGLGHKIEDAPTPTIEIHWGGRIYIFASAAEALAAGFYI